jgi:hypothetical protein
VLDFKQTIDKTKAGSDIETCRDVAQFANTFGGCLLIGVSEQRDPVSGLKVAGPVVPLQQLGDPDQLRGWIEQWIAKYLVPSTFTHDVIPISLAGGAVLAVNVEASRYLVPSHCLGQAESHVPIPAPHESRQGVYEPRRNGATPYGRITGREARAATC